MLPEENTKTPDLAQFPFLSVGIAHFVLPRLLGESRAGSGPIAFTNGAPSSELTYTFTSLASACNVVSFSSNSGATFGYPPVVNVNGVDPAVMHIRPNPKGAFNVSSNFQVIFRVRV